MLALISNMLHWHRASPFQLNSLISLTWQLPVNIYIFGVGELHRSICPASSKCPAPSVLSWFCRASLVPP